MPIKFGPVRIYTADEVTVTQAASLVALPKQPETPQCYIAGNTFRSDVYDVVHPESYDFALPQPFFDNHLKKHGKAPEGVWSYRNNCIFGEFYSWDDALADLAQFAAVALENADKETQ
jgi:hypothetical protein